MSPKRPPRDLTEVARVLSEMDPEQLRQVAEILEHQREAQTKVWSTEPANRRIVKFSGRFEDGGKVYSFVAVRADNWRPDSARWFVSQANDLGREPVLRSPCTWPELIEFAEPHTVSVAPSIAHWRPVSNLPA